MLVKVNTVYGYRDRYRDEHAKYRKRQETELGRGAITIFMSVHRLNQKLLFYNSSGQYKSRRFNVI